MLGRNHPLDVRTAIPKIGTRACAGCDGPVLVLNDMLGLNSGHVRRHVKQYANLKATVVAAVSQFRDEVREGNSPEKSPDLREVRRG
jgi:3-methyl-2-oxobutanoate hydroxymethyltransferase